MRPSSTIQQSEEQPRVSETLTINATNNRAFSKSSYGARQISNQSQTGSDPTKLQASFLDSLRNITAAPTNVDKVNARKHWDFISANKDILASQTYLERLNEKKYESYLQIPDCFDMVSNILKENKKRKKIIAQRKQKQRFISITDETIDTNNNDSNNESNGNDNDNNNTNTNKELIKKLKLQNMLDKTTQESIKSNESEIKNYNLLKKIVAILNIEPTKRSFQDLIFLYKWLVDNCKHSNKNDTNINNNKSNSNKHNGLIHKYLQSCSYMDGVKFVQGLQYDIFDTGHCILKQNEIGSEYYILLTGNVNIHNNPILGTVEMPNIKDEAKKYGRLGIGKYIDTLSDIGDDFGEYSLVSNNPSSETYVCKKISQFLVCTRDHFQKCLEKYTNTLNEGLVNKIKQFDIYSNCSNYWLQSIVKHFKMITLHSGDIIMKQNETQNKVYLIFDSDCKITANISNSNKLKQKRRRKNTNNKNIKTDVVSILNGKQLIGGFETINGIKNRYNVTVTSDSDALIINKNRFVHSCSKHVIDEINRFGSIQHKHVLNQIQNKNSTLKRTRILINSNNKHVMNNTDKDNDNDNDNVYDIIPQRTKHVRSKSMSFQNIQTQNINSSDNIHKTIKNNIEQLNHVNGNQSELDSHSAMNTTRLRLRSKSFENLKSSIEYNNHTSIKHRPAMFKHVKPLPKLEENREYTLMVQFKGFQKDVKYMTNQHKQRHRIKSNSFARNKSSNILSTHFKQSKKKKTGKRKKSIGAALSTKSIDIPNVKQRGRSKSFVTV